MAMGAGQREPLLFEEPGPHGAGLELRRLIGARAGVLPCQALRALIRKNEIAAAHEIAATQIQPASLDLRLDRYAYRVRASFLPGPDHTVEDKLDLLGAHRIDLAEGQVLETNCVYVVPLMERLKLRDTIAAVANPKSSTGRLDVFTRLIADRADAFDYVPAGYEGRLYIEISPRSFSILVRPGSTLNQIRFRHRGTQLRDDGARRLSDRELSDLHRDVGVVGADHAATFRDGLNLRVDLTRRSRDGLIGYKAKRFSGFIDLDAPGAHEVRQYWEELYQDDRGRLVLDPHEFYILASQESVVVPPDYAAEMAPIDPMIGEYRVHYAGFFDPGFGCSESGGQGARAVLEVRSLDIPFILEDGQIIGRLMYEKLTETPDQLYGQGIGSHYQAQGLKLSKHFRQG